jgi:hypothetical protein
VVHHQGWQASHLEQVLWEQAEGFRQEVEKRGETPLCVWDSSVLESAPKEAHDLLSCESTISLRRGE